MANPSLNYGDEIVIDESLTDVHTVGDFDVSSFAAPFDMGMASLFDENGEIVSGKLYSFFKRQGMESVQEIRLGLDLDPDALRADYELDSIELRIEDLESGASRLFSLGSENSIKLPGYESSAWKPEAQFSIKLDYDFMEHFNENSTEKLKFNYMVGGKEMALPVKVAVLPEKSPAYSSSRAFFFVAFIVFWVLVFLVLFRMTTPKSQNAASPA